MTAETVDRPKTDDHLDHEFVTVDLNGEKRRVRKGEYTGRSLKAVLMVPSDHELDEVVKGEFRLIEDDSKVHIKGGEVFVSHCGQGGSS
jgi:hypothetical protein